MGGLEIEKTKECHFTLEIFNSRDKEKRKLHGEHLYPTWHQKCTIFESPGFVVRPT
jgi:hypothetical protein